MVMGRGTIEFKDTEITSSVVGIEPGVFEKTTLTEIEEGRFLTDSDQRVAVIGASVSETMFGNKRSGLTVFS